ncbi:MAG: glycerol-3-phosphate acyltransferase [Candidatus Neomarinimicrobiota bacterium]
MDPIFSGSVSIVLGYLLGSILPAYFLAKAWGFDIRQKGSGNPGVSNVADTMGYTAAVFVALYDLGKGPLAILLAGSMGNSLPISYLAGFAALIGHRAPFYLRFRGGEGLATTVGIGFYSIAMMLIDNGRYAFVVLPILVLIALAFFLTTKPKQALILVFIFVPLLLNATILFYGINIHSVIISIVCLLIIGHRLAKLLKNTIQEMPEEERKLLWRKWLRPIAIVFPLGAFFYKQYVLGVLLAVFSSFVVFEIIRFRTKYKRFPLPYKKAEESRISSMVVFLFAAVLVLWFFPTNIASLALLFVVFGDLLAWCIGRTIGGKGFLNKTWGGTTACLVTCVTLAIFYYSLNLVALPVGLLGALSATAVEIAPLQEDNFVMPVVSAIVMTIV